ncbi:MAG TPA: MFS transporter [Patescibacteria group bacterium]|nr:MFS transporter [Patescibacteria group bacterium]
MAASTTTASLNRRIYFNIVFPLFIVSVIAYIDRVNIGYAALTLNGDLRFTPEVFGFGAGILFAGYLLFAIPGALIAEKTSARIWLGCMTVCWGVISAMMAFMHTPLEFYVIRFLLGAAEASLYPVAYAIFIPRWFRPRERALAIAVLLASLQVSGIVGAPLAGWMLGVSLLGFKGWQILFLLEAIPAVLIGLAIPFWMADRPRQASWLTADEKALLAQRYEQEVAAKASVHPYKVLDALKDREVLKLCFIYFLWITSFWGFNYWMPTVLKSVSGWSNVFIGEVFAMAMAVSLVVSIYVGHFSSKYNEKRWHGAVPLFLAAIGMGASAYVHEPWVYFVFLVVTAAGVYAPLAVWWSYPTVFLSGAAAAGAVGMINSMGNVGGFVGPYLTGWIRQTTGSFAMAMLYMAFSLAAAGLLILTLRKKLPAHSVQETVPATPEPLPEAE